MAESGATAAFARHPICFSEAAFRHRSSTDRPSFWIATDVGAHVQHAGTLSEALQVAPDARAVSCSPLRAFYLANLGGARGTWF